MIINPRPRRRIDNLDLPPLGRKQREAELITDFGHHNYDIKGKAAKGHEKGNYHTEFQST